MQVSKWGNSLAIPLRRSGAFPKFWLGTPHGDRIAIVPVN
jgi:hypothetical protein